MSFPNETNLISDENIWIADIGGLVHSTPYSYGMTNVVNAGMNDTMTTQGGSKMKSYSNWKCQR